ncbi:cilia- and flagella-associated protein 97 [Myripristis murdjan]|uniref:Cilia- and flagella-associated protein 97 n=1 Tax=Myripristis murdjan TaxID=586833 RepID=A0A667ZXA3_9TELE|nr:cilia- and flagella-associated protein 97 [Myripristis murdjan]
MFSRRELEGEVDFSFFDSDCDDNNTSKDEGKELDKSLKAENESLSVPEQLHARHSQSAGAFVGGGTKIHPKQVEKSNTIAAENKEYSYGSQTEELSRISTTSLVACASEKVTRDGGDGDVSRLHSKRLNETFIALLAESREVDEEDGYHQSQNESEDDEGLSSTHRYSGSKGRNGSACKKLTRKRHPRSPSPPSTEAGADSDTDSSCGSSDVSCSLEPLTLTKPKTSLASSSPRVRRTSAGSAGSRGWPASRTEECEDTVTDVTPLSTPDISPIQSLDLSQGCRVTETEYGGLKELQPESVPSSGLSNTPQDDENSDHDVDDCSIRSESQVGGELVFQRPGGRDRKNYSFSNDEVRRIDRENQRLLRELSRLSSRPGSTVGKKPQAAKNSPVVRLSHSAINRQREQKRIERENLAFLKRLESVKPTPGMKCSEQLADYQRQARYLGASSYPIYRSTSKKERPSSKMPSGRSPRPASAAHHGSRAVSATVDSTTAPANRSRKASAPRPAWC